MTLRFLDYEASRAVPNIVVDGSANESTVLTLSHWPGAQAPEGLARDLSAEMAFAYLDQRCAHAPADVVTNNHFDQDGLVSVHALVEPELSSQHRELLIDIAAAGDFGIYNHRNAARASMVIAHWCAQGWGYEEALPRLVPLALDPEPYRHLWADEDEELSDSETAIASGRVSIDVRAHLDLAIVDIPDTEPRRSGHRFAHQSFDGIHPMALHNAVTNFRLLVICGNRYSYVDRYETWVQYQSQHVLPRVDMAALAATFNDQEVGESKWAADDVNDLSPTLRHTGASGISRTAAVNALIDYLQSPPQAR